MIKAVQADSGRRQSCLHLHHHLMNAERRLCGHLEIECASCLRVFAYDFQRLMAKFRRSRATVKHPCGDSLNPSGPSMLGGPQRKKASAWEERLHDALRSDSDTPHRIVCFHHAHTYRYCDKRESDTGNFMRRYNVVKTCAIFHSIMLV